MKKRADGVDARQGTVIWGLNRFRSDALAELLNDLVDLERTGLADDQCGHVRVALSKVTNKASAIPDGSFWKTSIYVELQKFEECYGLWNSHAGETAPMRRRESLKELRKRRNRIAKRIRENQFILQNELDLRLIRDMYDAMGGLAIALPEIFVSVSRAVKRFNKMKRVSGI